MVKETPPVGETKAEKFRRIGNRRLENALAEMQKLRSLSTVSNYDYTEEQAKVIVELLEEEVTAIERCFAEGGDKVPNSRGYL